VFVVLICIGPPNDLLVEEVLLVVLVEDLGAPAVQASNPEIDK